MSAREEQLVIELNAALRLHELSTHLINGQGIDALFGHVLDAAVAIMHSDFASMQVAELNHQNSPVLRLLAYRRFHPESARHWQIVGMDDQASCGAALPVGGNKKTIESLTRPASTATCSNPWTAPVW